MNPQLVLSGTNALVGSRTVRTNKSTRESILKSECNPLPVLDATLFDRMLSLEHRRLERTGVPFALVILDVKAAVHALGESSIESTAAALGDAMRETDTTGWYEEGSTVGIILTALNGSDRQKLQAVVAERVKNRLSSKLDAAQMREVFISCQVFPQDSSASPVDASDPASCRHQERQRQTGHIKHSRVKRAIDLAGSAVALIVLSPLFLVIASLVRMTSPGPVFFRQKRVGQNGEEFTFLKFRSMAVNNDTAIHQEYVKNLIANKASGAGGPLKIQNDPRVTAIGRLLRKSSMDELPQFINVLKGDMSLVGPRPPIPYELENYSLWHRRRVLEAKPGITGAWQVEGRSRTTFDEMVRMDLRYIRSQSVWLDLKILLKTPLAVINGNGAL